VHLFERAALPDRSVNRNFLHAKLMLPRQAEPFPELKKFANQIFRLLSIFCGIDYITGHFRVTELRLSSAIMPNPMPIESPRTMRDNE